MDRSTRRGRGPLVAVLAAVLLLATPSAPAAHEVPANVTARVLVKPEDGRLRILVRTPLLSMRDVLFPTVPPRGYLDLEGTAPLLPGLAKTWIADYLHLRENGEPLPAPEVVAARVTLPGDDAFPDWDRALAHTLAAPFPGGALVVPEHALLDVLLEVPVTAATSDFSLEPGLAHLGIRTVTVLHFLAPGGAERVYRYEGDPGLVRLDPRWHHAAFRFVALGFEHILEGLDHILFLLCLVIPVRRVRPLVAVVTAFTVAHSLTLGAAVLGLTPDALWFPALVETLIALSIVAMALEVILGARIRGRWLVAFGFGLVHGFGFSFLLTESLQFAGAHLATSLLAFNVGVELGQLALLVVMVPALAFVLRRLPKPRMGEIVLAALVAHTAWHWMTARGADLLQYDIRLPPVDLFLLADVMRWTALALVAGVAAWLVGALAGRLEAAGGEGRGPAGPGAPAPAPARSAS